ncbi:MAG: hypothetical protein IJ364_05415 [Oscillospiraceae bacterium]|nr:hypothetical protein [Oscillospiraceae bacterium]
MSKPRTTSRKGLEAITQTTTNLWYKVNKKYGNHVYTLGVNGLDEVVLRKGYGEEIVRGNNREVQKVLRELLAN